MVIISFYRKAFWFLKSFVQNIKRKIKSQNKKNIWYGEAQIKRKIKNFKKKLKLKTF